MKRLLLLLALVAGSRLLAAAAVQPVAPVQPVAVTDTRFRAQKLDLRNVGDETITVLTGSVEVTGTDLQISCDRLEIVSKRVGPGTTDLVAAENRFKSLIATGRVRIVQPDSRREATCGRAEILPGDGRITLTDKPILVDRDEKGTPVRTLAGAEMRLYKGESRVEVILPEGSASNLPDLGFDATKVNAPAPAATPAQEPPPPAIQLQIPGVSK